MAHLTLAGVSDDGKRLLLVSDAGVEYTVDIDPRLRAALRGDPERRLEIRMDSALRPRDIQARIRAGETAEALAEEAQTTVEKIMTFAAPVLAERQHVAERAQRSSVRRKGLDNGSAGGARTLGDVVAFHLRSLNIDPGSVTWDAWRREDGRWTLTGEYSATKRTGAAHFTFDAPGNFVTADNDDARWLLGEPAPGSRAADAAPAADDLGRARERRLASVPEEELPLGDDAIELVTEPADEQAPRRPRHRDAAGGVPHRRADRRRVRGPGGGCRGCRSRHRGRGGAADPAAHPQEPGPGVGAELGRDHVRRRQERLIPGRVEA